MVQYKVTEYEIQYIKQDLKILTSEEFEDLSKHVVKYSKYTYLKSQSDSAFKKFLPEIKGKKVCFIEFPDANQFKNIENLQRFLDETNIQVVSIDENPDFVFYDACFSFYNFFDLGYPEKTNKTTFDKFGFSIGTEYVNSDNLIFKNSHNTEFFLTQKRIKEYYLSNAKEKDPIFSDYESYDVCAVFSRIREVLSAIEQKNINYVSNFCFVWDSRKVKFEEIQKAPNAVFIFYFDRKNYLTHTGVDIFSKLVNYYFRTHSTYFDVDPDMLSGLISTSDEVNVEILKSHIYNIDILKYFDSIVSGFLSMNKILYLNNKNKVVDRYKQWNVSRSVFDTLKDRDVKLFSKFDKAFKVIDEHPSIFIMKFRGILEKLNISNTSLELLKKAFFESWDL